MTKYPLYDVEDKRIGDIRIDTRMVNIVFYEQTDYRSKLIKSLNQFFEYEGIKPVNTKVSGKVHPAAKNVKTSSPLLIYRKTKHKTEEIVFDI